MVWQRKVIWAEGMFLRPQHFQQQERFLFQQLQSRSLPGQPFFWGFSELVLDADLLRLGKLGLRSARGVMPDGTPFQLPDNDEAPAPLDIGKDLKDVVIHLALPLRRLAGSEVTFGDGGHGPARYLSDVREVADSNDVGAQPAELQLGSLRLSLRPAHEITEGWVSLPVAHVIERQAHGAVLLDTDFIPTVVNNGPSSVLDAFCKEIHGLLRQRGEVLAQRMIQPERGGIGEVGDFLLLQLINHWTGAAQHWMRVATVHPERLFEELSRLAAELTTFDHERRRPQDLPAYDHDDLRRCFPPLMLELRRSLSSVLEQNAIQIPLHDRQYGVRVALIPSTELLTTCDFVLAAHAQTTPDFLRTHFPTQTKLGPVERIRDLVNLHLPGVTLRPLPIAPREIPYHAGYNYFEVDTTHDLWNQLQSSGGLAMHVSGEFPELRLEFWAIRR
jgi:type VI secretion system protein ImpJ